MEPALSEQLGDHSGPDPRRGIPARIGGAGKEREDAQPELLTLESTITPTARIPVRPRRAPWWPITISRWAASWKAISKSRFWPKSLILVVEDDAQDGFDHVDGHRTVALAIGPYVRRDAVDSNHYNHTSMVRTIQEIFQIPQRTRFLVARAP